MHELSLANNIVDLIEDSIRTDPLCTVTTVHLRLGVLAGVVKEALLFGFEVASIGTRLEGATLKIEEIPVGGYCHTCQQEVILATLQYLRCPYCDTPLYELHQGKELQVMSIEVLDDETANLGN